MFASMDLQQCRMARAALGWSLDDLAASAGVARRTIARFEAGETVQPDKVSAMRAAFEAKRVRFIDDGDYAGAVMLMRRAK